MTLNIKLYALNQKAVDIPAGTSIWLGRALLPLDWGIPLGGRTVAGSSQLLLNRTCRAARCSGHQRQGSHLALRDCQEAQILEG